MKRLTALFLTLALLLSLAACGAAPAEPTVPAGTAAPVETAAPVSSAPAEPKSTAITLVDMAGREVTLEKEAETIVSCYYITTYACMALGVSDRIVGLEKKADSRPIYHMAAPGLLELPNVGSLKEFNVEAAAALEPDLVIMPIKLKGHADTLAELGIAVLVVNPETQEGLEEMLKLIAAACGVKERAEALLAYYQAKRDALQESTLLISTIPLVYLGSNSSLLETAPSAMYQSDLISLAGGLNAAAELEGDYWTGVSYETILTWNPDVIIIPCGASYTKEDVLSDAQLADIAAVKNGAVYQMPQEIEEWDSPIPSGILGALWLHSVLHPTFYTFEAFQADVTEYYEAFYGFTIDTALITK